MKKVFLLIAMMVAYSASNALADVSTRQDVDCSFGESVAGYGQSTLADLENSSFDISGPKSQLHLDAIKIQKKKISSMKYNDSDYPKDSDCISTSTKYNVIISGKETSSGVVISVKGQCTEKFEPGGCVKIQ